jgi:hypothetical protein
MPGNVMVTIKANSESQALHIYQVISKVKWSKVTFAGSKLEFVAELNSAI